MAVIERFFADLDARWRWQAPERVRLKVIGFGALMLQTDYRRGTKDGDVLETAALAGATKQRLLDLAGEGTDLHRRHRLYLDVVPNGLPFLPLSPDYHPLESFNRSLEHFALEVLDIVDVVVSKLKRFNANDQSDIAAMIDGDHVEHDRLIARFRSAVDVFSGDARAENLPTYVANLHQVERDLFGTAETEIELPTWI